MISYPVSIVALLNNSVSRIMIYIMRGKDKKALRTTYLISVFLLFISGLLLTAARRFPGFAPWYAATVYPFCVGIFGRISGLLHFSLSEILCAAIPMILIADLIVCISGSLKRESRASGGLLRFITHTILLVSVLLFLYSANCGINYYRDPFIDPQEYTDTVFSTDELSDFCEYTVLRLRECYDLSGDTSVYPDGAELADAAVRSMHHLSKEHPGLKGFYPRPKQLTFMSSLFSGMGVSGIYSPFTIEANVNGEMTGLEKPFTSCHELSHLRGYMNEGEANYIGWLACIGSDDPAFRRSGWLISWIYAGGSLRRSDPDLYESIYRKLPDAAVEELTANSKFWAEHETGASEVQNRVNDAYLKSNGQPGGIQTYGTLTTLMLLWQRNMQ